MSDASNKSAPGSGEPESKQAVGDASVKGVSSGESLVKQEVSGSELPEKRSPSAGREASYVYDVLNLPSTVDTTGMRPNPRFEVKQSTFGQDLQEQSKSADELVQRKESSYLYKEELAKIGKGVLPTTGAVLPPPSEKDGPEYRLSEEQSKAYLFGSPWPWTAAASPEVVQKNIATICEKKDRAVRVADESILSGSDFTLFAERRLFANKRNAFFLGKFKGQLALVKKVTSGTASVTSIDPLWVSIAKRISYTQQMQEDKAVAKAQALAADSSSDASESTATSADGSEERPSSSTASSGKTATAAVTVHLPVRPFLQVYEIFRLESDHSLLVFMEIGVNKTLHNHVKRRAVVDAAQARLWSAQLLDGISFLVNHGVAHRAIRLEHILLDSDCNARLIGWRRALPLSAGALTRRERRARSNNHLPPEAFLASYEPANVDLWSWGVVLCALATFRYPFNVRTQRGSIEEEWTLFKARHPASGHPQVMALLDTLFLNDPEKRASLLSIQKSSWFGAGGTALNSQQAGQTEEGQVAKSASEKSIAGKNV